MKWIILRNVTKGSFGLQCIPKDDFVRNIACEYGPGSQIHNDDQLDQIQNGQSWREEHSHPHLPLIIYQMQNVFGNFKITILLGSD